MYKPSIGLSLEGLPFVFFTAIATLTFALLDCWFMATVLLVVLFLVLNFFRDPERVVPQEPGIAVSPADGKVIKVETMRDPMTGEDRTAVCVFMNVFNVHVNRMPVAGRIARISYFGGKFLNASFDKASTDNERNSLLIEDGDGRSWTMVQIAGLIARRIICWGEEGDALSRGQRFGLIKFGSRVDLYLPAEYEPSVRIGDKVFAGQSILARKK
ncbi:MAG: phosphatidylserine decarboxylase family protein [Deltaproteobacteria bacterium HGW-Deltaproteobacteria-18]|nr:MAG: phosphatidylserine decarboxylase family protein [Deltaproteobacteria bacterium HGW-Deltaproteobacteria-18]